mmetsp:Transcript_19329/g.35900  ORF Transcript_19329/g.35900 Transcript_19329/m.35900 type:complete len:220 (-) Transcript_19329:38-697(-)
MRLDDADEHIFNHRIQVADVVAAIPSRDRFNPRVLEPEGLHRPPHPQLEQRRPPPHLLLPLPGLLPPLLLPLHPVQLPPLPHPPPPLPQHRAPLPLPRAHPPLRLLRPRVYPPARCPEHIHVQREPVRSQFMAGHRELDATATPAKNKHPNLLHLRNNPLPLPPFLRVPFRDIPVVPPRVADVPRAGGYGDGALGREERVVLVRGIFGRAGGDECLLWG